jgi:hypothetical protein
MLSAAQTAERRPPNGILPWHKKLPPDDQRELEAIRERFERGEYGRLNQSEAALAIIRWGEERGHAMPRRWAVVRWLTRKV